MRLGNFTNAAQVFDAVVQEDATRAAIRWDASGVTTYGELDRLSNQLAHVLVERGVRKRDPVCLCLDKCLAAYAAVVACLRIGAPYFFVDPTNPPARRRAIVHQCRPRIALLSSSLDASDFDCEALAIDERGDVPLVVARAPAGPVRRPDIDGSDPAYVMFTSGSTGTPKGVTISQSNVVHFIRWAQACFDVTPDDVFTNVNPLFFDNSVFDLYASLFAGASLVPFDAALLKEPALVLSRIGELGCTIYFSVPSLLIYFQRLKLVTDRSFPSARAIVFGGEGYPKPMLSRLHEQVGDRVALYNVYGPTECTCICSAYRVSASDFVDLAGLPPLGRLNDNFSHAIVDESGREAPPGTAGELLLGGPLVGLGYYGAPEQTAAAFVQNPTHDRFFDRMYRTGDLVRLDPTDGKLYFVGRSDAQIKLQGYRIELGEIEHGLSGIEGVEEAAAVFTNRDGTGRITAIVASRVDLAPSAIKERLAAALPRYMMPERVVVLPQLPKNANGKIDRKELAASIAAGTL